MPWEQVHLFWGDERWAPLQGPDSNFAMAWETLVSRVPIPPGNVHAVPVETGSPEEAAVKYEEMLKEFFRGQDREPGSPPRFDLILLGVGADGHTASLFPGSPLLEENGRWAAAALPPPTISPATPRVTFTLSVINAARCVLFLVSTAGKRELLSRVLDRPGETSELLPAARVRPRGELVWFLHDET
jgi:6-phosphogluconolactonase